MNLKLDEILKEVRHPCAEEIDDSLLQKLDQLEKRVDNALNDIRSDIRVHTNSLDEIRNDIRVHTNSLDKIRNDISAHTRSLNELRNNISAHTNSLDEIKQELNENRQYSTTKFHELRLDVDENFLDANTKRQELRRELKESLEDNVKISGTTYTRWGRARCPGNGSEAVYSGYAGGSHYSHKGAAASMVCLPKDPDWEQGKYSDKQEAHVAYIYGTEYEDLAGRSDSLFATSHHSQDMPCVVCNIKSRSSHIVIPGRTKCYPGWTSEYSGYLMAGYYDHVAATDYHCIDKDPEDIPGGTANLNGKVLYFVEAACGSLLCPPYVNGREFPCVVCSK